MTNQDDRSPEASAGEPEAPVGTASTTGREDPSEPAAVPEIEAPGEEEAPSSEAQDGEDIATLRSELEELRDKHLRLVAEFNNYRRRSEQERLGAWSRAQSELLAKFLEVLDDLNRVAELDLSNATAEAILEGVDLVEKKFLRILEDAGVEVIDPVGERFDPARMEGVMRMQATSDEQDDSVAQVLQKGYALQGRLVRPARVAVYKHG